MPVYSFDARDFDGRSVRGVESAADLGALDSALEQRKLLLVSASVGRNRAARRAHSGRVLIDFCHHLATAVEAGVPLTTALRDLQEGGQSAIAEPLEDVTRKIESGQTLSQAMESYPQIFPPLARSLIAAGEQTGDLPRILRDLVKNLEWSEDLRRKLRGALLYPCIVLVGMLGLVALLTTVVLPNFLNLFAEFKVELPLITRAMIAFQHLVVGYWPFLLLSGGAVAGAFVLALRNERGRYRIHRLLLGLPLIGSVLSMIEMSRFSHNLGLLYAAGIPIVRGLEMVAGIVQNLVVREVVVRSISGVKSGESLTAALGQSEFMPPLVMRMVSLGEHSGSLEKSLDHVASYYDREVPGIIDRALALFNTALILSLGIMLAGIALGVFVPLYQMMGNLNETP